MDSAPVPLRLRFGRLELDESRYALLRDGEPVGISPKPLAILFYLARHRDRVVRKDELLAAVWAGTVVTDDAVWRSIFRAREALGDTDPQTSAIETVRGIGFRFVADAHDLAEPIAAAPAAESAPLVGRERELAVLRGAFARAAAGSGGLALVVGEPGIGKTRLAEALAPEARRAGAAIHESRSHEGPSAPALWLWTQILESMADPCAPDAFHALAGADAGELARAVPRLAGRLDAPPAPLADGEAASVRLLHALGRLLARAARVQPQLLLLDDLQWADPDSLWILAGLAPVLRRERVLVVATTREHELARSEPLQDVLIEHAKCESLVRVVLAGLEPAHVATLVELQTGASPDPDGVARLHRRTDGNPLFVREELELARLSDADERAAAETSHLSPGIRRVASRRVAGVAPATRAVLELAAVIGTGFELPLLARAYEGGREQLLTALDDATAARILDAPRPGATVRRFRHDLLREALASELPITRRAALHHAVAEALRDLHAGHLEPVVPALAHHFGEAAPLHGGALAARFSKWAGDLARQAAAHADAAAHYERGLRALALGGGPDPQRRAELLVALGYALRSAGRTGEARETLREAAALARGTGDAPLHAIAALGVAEFFMMIGDRIAIELLEEALGRLPATEDALRIRLQSALAIQLAEVNGRQDEAARLAHAAEAQARQRRGRRSLASALLARTIVERTHPDGSAPARLALATEAEEVVRGRGETSLELMSCLARHGALLELGDRTAADAELERLTQWVKRVRAPYWHHLVPTMQAGRALLDGRFDDAEEHLRQAAGAGGAHTAPPSPMALAPVLGALRLEQGRETEILASIEPLVEMFPDYPAFQAAAQLAALAVGRADDARRRFERMARDDFRSVVGSVEWFFTVSMLATVCFELEAVGAVPALERLLAPRAGHWVSVGNGSRFLAGPTSQHLAALALTAGDLDAARRHVELALDRADAMRSPPWRAHALALRSWIGDRCAGADARRSARADARQARGIARELGMVRLLRQLDARSLPAR